MGRSSKNKKPEEKLRLILHILVKIESLSGFAQLFLGFFAAAQQIIDERRLAGFRLASDEFIIGNGFFNTLDFVRDEHNPAIGRTECSHFDSPFLPRLAREIHPTLNGRLLKLFSVLQRGNVSYYKWL
jgi:hypothetical protein